LDRALDVKREERKMLWVEAVGGLWVVVGAEMALMRKMRAPTHDGAQGE